MSWEQLLLLEIAGKARTADRPFTVSAGVARPPENELKYRCEARYRNPGRRHGAIARQ
jgi:hypothetical protein